MAPNTLTKEEQTTLTQKATAAKSSAYCPYSTFRVGATLLTTTGAYISGANVENVSYPVGTCAERVAFGSAVASSSAGEGLRSGEVRVKGVAVASDTVPGASPCGMCRQFMREFTTRDVPVHLVDKEGGFVVRTMGELLPDSFGPGDLPH